MNQQEILKKIGGIIAELKEQHTYLEANSSSFDDLELELFTANANFLIDHTEILKKIHHHANPVAATVAKPEKIYPTKPIVLDYFSEEEYLPFMDDPSLKKLNSIPADNNPKPEQTQFLEQQSVKDETIVLSEIVQDNETLAPFTIADTSFTTQKSVPEAETPAPFMIADTSFTAQKSVPTEKEEVENAFEEAEIEPVSTTETEIQYLQEIQKPELFFAEELKPEPAKPEPIQQAFIKPEPAKPEAEPVLTLNQRIAVQKSLEQPAAKTGFEGKQAQDLPALISLNDKLLFVKELFNGYNLAYSEAVNILNRYTNFEQAEQFLKNNYGVKNNWKDKPATAERFYDLLRKRFS